MKFVKEHWPVGYDGTEPFPQFLRTCGDMELVVLQHEARAAQDDETLQAVLMELRRRARLTS